MRRPTLEVHDMVATAGATRSSIEDRVNRRLYVLREWKEKGLPFGEGLPESLTAVRLWDNEKLGIQKISSPNEFTRSHPRVGQSVREIDSILAQLRVLYAEPATKARLQKPSATSKLDAKAAEKQLRAAASQWQTERSARLAAERRANAADARNRSLRKDLDDRDREIAELTARVAASAPLRSVK